MRKPSTCSASTQPFDRACLSEPLPRLLRVRIEPPPHDKDQAMRTVLLAHNITLFLLMPFICDTLNNPLSNMVFGVYVCLLGFIGIYLTESDSAD